MMNILTKLFITGDVAVATKQVAFSELAVFHKCLFQIIPLYFILNFPVLCPRPNDIETLFVPKI